MLPCPRSRFLADVIVVPRCEDTTEHPSSD
jgi:hypothetical protein